MTVINTSHNKLIQIGYEGEDKVTILRFSYSDKWLENGEGVFTVRVLRNGENQAYNAQVIQDNREDYTIDMTVTDVELSKKGYGEMQLVYTGADFVKKSPVYKYYVSRSVDEAVDPPESDVYTQIIESLSDLRTNFDELTNTVSEINGDIGDLTELTTANKLNIVESINEVNSKSFVSVDDELSDASTNPVQNKVITARINGLDSDVGTLRTSVQSKADTQTVSALADAVQDLDGDVQGLQTTVQAKADTSTVTALSGTVSGLQTAVQSKADAQTVTTLSGTVTGLQASKADKSYVDTQLVAKASAQTVSDLSDDVSDLQTGLAGKIEIPHTDEAKIAIQKMLGIYEAPWELINEETFTNETEADYIIATDANGNAFELTDVVLMFETPRQSTVASKGEYGDISFNSDINNTVSQVECGGWTQNSNDSAHGVMVVIKQDGNMIITSATSQTTNANNGNVRWRYAEKFKGAAQTIQYTQDRIAITLIKIIKVMGTGHYELYGKRKWT